MSKKTNNNNRTGKTLNNKPHPTTQDKREGTTRSKPDRTYQRPTDKYNGNNNVQVSNGIPVRNELSWYTADAVQEDLVARVSFNTKLGDPVHLLNYVDTEVSSEFEYKPAEIMKVVFSPTYGSSTGSDSTLQKAADAIAAYIRSQLKTTANYDNAETMKYLIHMDSLYMRLITDIRTLLIMNKYNYSNKSLPQGMINALGYDYEDMRKHYRDYITRLNFCIMDIANMYVPGLFHFIARHMFLCGNIFRDSERPNAQLYIMNPSCYFQIQYPDDQPSRLVAVPNPGEARFADALVTFDTELSYLEEAIRYVTDNKDFDRISADMMNAYGVENGISMDTISTELVVEPILNHEFNLQLHNSIAVGDPGIIGVTMSDEDESVPVYSITERIIESSSQGTRGWLESHYTCVAPYHAPRCLTNMPGARDTLFDCTEVWSGDKATIIEGTRMCPGSFRFLTINPNYVASDKMALDVFDVASEIVNHYTICQLAPMNPETGSTIEELKFNNYMYMGGTGTTIANAYVKTALAVLGALSSFTWAPFVYADYNSGKLHTFGTTFQYAALPVETRKNVNKYCVYGEFRMRDLRFGTLSTSNPK